MTTNPAIVLIGFMGAGKSSAAESLVGSVDQVWDLDDWTQRQLGMPISTYFETWTEEQFRQEEAKLASKLLRDAAGGVVAFGGGTILSESVRAELKHHVVVWLQIDAQTAWDRVAEGDRPLAQDRDKFHELFVERQPIYESLADVVLPQSDPGVALRAWPSIQALKALPSGTKLLWATSTSGEYPIFVGHGLLKSDWWPVSGRKFLIADTATASHFKDRPVDSFIGINLTVSGEKTKTMNQAERILEDMASKGLTREDHVVALGGGVTGDIAGFCAHVYQRGIPVVQVPTTLVAQVDSAYGGKTGVDLPQAKNYVGAYHLPAAVIADIETLGTLPREELAAGFVEALKTGLLSGGLLWDRVRSIEVLDSANLDDVIYACARYKCEVVAADERDLGLRQVLNLGHTVGHAIETASGYERYRHGEAIGLGLLAALRLSNAPRLRDEIRKILKRHGLPVTLDPAIAAVPILDALERDKKRTSEGVGFVLLSEPGEPRTGQLVNPARVEAAVKELYE
jgi:shikimate kinase/3-dehydroquinate synthase